MPEKRTTERASRAKRQGKSAGAQAGEFVREEIHHVREGKHGARSAKQAVAIGLSKARRAGVKLPAPSAKRTSAETRRKAERDLEKGAHGTKKVSRRRSAATERALEKEGRSAASPRALSMHARKAAKQRTAKERSASAKKAARTKGPGVRKAAARKAARTRAARSS
jgi:hypothetical protein